MLVKRSGDCEVGMLTYVHLTGNIRVSTYFEQIAFSLKVYRFITTLCAIYLIQSGVGHQFDRIVYISRRPLKT